MGIHTVVFVAAVENVFAVLILADKSVVNLFAVFLSKTFQTLWLHVLVWLVIQIVHTVAINS